MKAAFTFPGQGSQAVGMGKELADASPAAAEVFARVDDALGKKLSALMWDGPTEELTLTENAQPALMATSMAAMAVLADEGVSVASHAAYVAGHSLGEYSALCAAGAFSIEDAARLLRIRGQAMQSAVPVGEGAMAALLGLDLEDAQAVGQVVVSGAKSAVERALDIAKGKGAKRAVLLPVSAPFHCALMQPAAEKMAEALANVNLNAPAAPVVSNVRAAAVSDPAEIKGLLVQQVTGAVRWREGVLWMAGQGVDTLLEIGAGKVLTGLVRRIDKSLTGVAVNTPDDAKSVAATLKG